MILELHKAPFQHNIVDMSATVFLIG